MAGMMPMNLFYIHKIFFTYIDGGNDADESWRDDVKKIL